jgi:hypothetical protein
MYISKEKQRSKRTAHHTQYVTLTIRPNTRTPFLSLSLSERPQSPLKEVRWGLARVGHDAARLLNVLK